MSCASFLATSLPSSASSSSELYNILSSVPQPTVSISRSRSGNINAGTEFGLIADISFIDLSAVDVAISLDISWSRDSDVIASDTRTAISPVSDSGDSYTASLTYTPIATSDGGWFTATVTVSPSDGSMFVQTVTATDTEMITVEGMN